MMKLNLLSFLLLSFLFLLSQPQKPKNIQITCLCDTTESCDYQCCCDAECIGGIDDQLDKYHKCDDDGFGIPLCEEFNNTDIHVDDLYSGLKTIYTIVKRLFCLSRTNNVDPTSFYQASTDVSTDASLISEAITADFDEQSLSAIHASTLTLTQATVNGVFFRDGAGICQTTNKIREKDNSGLQKCRVQVTATSSIGTHPILSTTELQTTLGSLNVYSMDDISSYDTSGNTSTAASCSSNDCSNVVRLVKLFFKNDNTISTDFSYIVVGKAEITDGSYVSVQYDYQYLTSSSSFAISSNQAYTIGAPLQLLQLSTATTEYYKIQNPINLAFKDINGACQTTAGTDSSDSLVELVFGKNVMYTCYGATSIISTQLSELMSTNTLYVGKLGSANTILADYTAIQWSDVVTTQSAQLVFYYVKVGEESNYQYAITKGKVNPIETKNDQSTLYVQFEEVSNTAQIFIPSPPTADAYLPNDFLSPFFIAE